MNSAINDVFKDNLLIKFDQKFEILDKVEEILPKIAELAEKAEQDRMVPTESINLLKSINLHRAFQPKKYGGLEMQLSEFENCIIAIAAACPNTAWAFALLAKHAHMIAMYPEEAQDEIWGKNSDAVASSSIAPFGKIEQVEGGYLFSGEMGWSSGCDHAEWAILGCTKEGENGEKQRCFAIVPREDYEIKDTWFTVGMRGSGSKTLVLKNVFVPEHRLQNVMDLGVKFGGVISYPESNIYSIPFLPVFALCFSSVSLGIAERMLSLYSEKTKNRVRAYTGVSVGTAAPALMRLAESTHQVACGRAFLEKTWKEMEIHAEKRLQPSAEKMAFWRTNQAYVVKILIESVDRLFSASGGMAWFEANELQRLFRNSHMTGAHAYTDYDVCSQILGRALMGLEPDPGLF
ncbi:TPA: flavin-dependent monooxygenase [Acinetobacter baumannii]